MSIYLIIMKGDFDSILIWPFAKRVTITLLDQKENSNDRKYITVNHPPNQLQQGLNSRPLGEFNISLRFPKFVSHDELMKRGYIQDDTIFIQAKFETVAP